MRTGRVIVTYSMILLLSLLIYVIKPPVLEAATLHAWGANEYGQLGASTPIGSIGVVQGFDGQTIVSVAPLNGANAAIKSVRRVNTAYAWGANYYGELGPNGLIDGIPLVYSATPLNIPFAKAPKYVMGGGHGNHFLAKLSDNTVVGWGCGGWNQLGSQTQTCGGLGNCSYPVPISFPTGTVADISSNGVLVPMAAGGYHSLAVMSASKIANTTVMSWGLNTAGQLGRDAVDTSIPGLVQTDTGNLTGIKIISAGAGHSLALKSDGTVWAWGDNTGGQSAGPVMGVNVLRARQVTGLTGVVYIEAGAYHSLAVKSDGTVWAWGGNSSGQLGNGFMVDSNVPAQVIGLTGVTKVAGGGQHSMALKNDGTVWAWGSNSSGQLGVSGYYQLTPVQVPTLAGKTWIGAGGSCSFAY